MYRTSMNKTIKYYYVMFTYWEINVVKIVNHPRIVHECNEIPVGDLRAWKESSNSLCRKISWGVDHLALFKMESDRGWHNQSDANHSLNKHFEDLLCALYLWKGGNRHGFCLQRAYNLVEERDGEKQTNKKTKIKT